MNSLMNMWFGPLPPVWCDYFYILAVIFAILFVVSVIAFIIMIIVNLTHFRKPNAFNMMVIINGIVVIINTFLAYLANRLLFTMCTRTL